MTDDDIHKSMGLVVDELATCRKRLACLQTRAEGYRKQITAADVVLGECIAGTVSALSERPAPSERGWPTYADFLSVHTECYETQRRIAQLEGRLREWGAIR